MIFGFKGSEIKPIRKSNVSLSKSSVHYLKDRFIIQRITLEFFHRLRKYWNSTCHKINHFYIYSCAHADKHFGQLQCQFERRLWLGNGEKLEIGAQLSRYHNVHPEICGYWRARCQRIVPGEVSNGHKKLCDTKKQKE